MLVENDYFSFLKPFLKKVKNIVLSTQNTLTSKIKSDESIVTNTDIFISDLFQKLIKKKFKNHSILDEEKIFQNKNMKEEIKNSEYVWIIDPIDGTKTYFYGSYLYATSIALYKNNLPLFSLIFLPALSKLIYTKNNSVYKITNFGTRKEQTEKVFFKKEKLTQNSLVYFSVKDAKKYIKDYKYTFIDGYSSYIYTYDVFNNIAKGAFLKSNVSMWDVYGSLPLAKSLGMEIYNIETGNTLEKLDFNLFKDTLKVKNIWLICHTDYKDELFSIL